MIADGRLLLRRCKDNSTLQMLRIRIGLIIQTMIAELSLALSASRVDPKTKDEAKIWTTQVSARSTLTVRKYG